MSCAPNSRLLNAVEEFVTTNSRLLSAEIVFVTPNLHLLNAGKEFVAPNSYSLSAGNEFAATNSYSLSAGKKFVAPNLCFLSVGKEFVVLDLYFLCVECASGANAIHLCDGGGYFQAVFYRKSFFAWKNCIIRVCLCQCQHSSDKCTSRASVTRSSPPAMQIEDLSSGHARKSTYLDASVGV